MFPNGSPESLNSVSAFAVYKKRQPTKKSTKKPERLLGPLKPQLKTIKKKKEVHQQNGHVSNNKLNKKKKLLLSKVMLRIDGQNKSSPVEGSDNGFNGDQESSFQMMHIKNKKAPQKNGGIIKIKKKKKAAVLQPAEHVEDDIDEVPMLVEVQETKGDLAEQENEVAVRQNQAPNPEIEDDVSDNPQTEALQVFKWMIAPISVPEFLRKYWEKRPLHIKRQKPQYYKHIMNSRSLDQMFREYPLQYTKNVDVVAYENGVKKRYNQVGRVCPTEVWDYYTNGCSVRILNPQTYNKKVHLLLATLQEYFGTMVGANVYLTPPNSQGFAPHHDDIEAFVIQLEGRKHWKLYQPSGPDVLTRYSSPDFDRDDLGAPFMDITVEAGDLLYFPRGVIHEGHTGEDSHSLHITVSVYQNTSYVDLLEKLLPEVLKKAAQENLAFRKGLPLNYLKTLGTTSQESDKKNRMLERISGMMKVLPKYLKVKDVDDAADQLGRKFVYDSLPPIHTKGETQRSSKGDGDYLDNGKVLNRIEINLETKVRLFRYYCIQLTNENNTIKLYYNTENANYYHGEEEHFLELEPEMVPVIKCLQNSYPGYVEIARIPVEDNVKLATISDLWERGLIVTSEPLSSYE